MSISLFKTLRTGLFTLGHMLTLTMILLFCLQSRGAITVGYLLFCVVFIYKSKDFIYKRSWTFPRWLSFFMKPYITIDLLLQFVYQIPIVSMHRDECSFDTWQGILGIYPLWGPIVEENSGCCNINSSRGEIMLKLLLFVIISLQSQIFASLDFKKYR